MRIVRVQPIGIVLDVRHHHRKEPGAGFLQVDVHVVRLDERAQQRLGAIDVLGTFWNKAWRHADQAWHLLAVIPQRHALGNNLLVVLVRLFHLRHRDRNGGVRGHDDLLGEERIVVVHVAPVDRARRHVAFLERRRQPLQRRGGGLLHRWIVKVQLAVRQHDTGAPVGDQEGVKQVPAVRFLRRHRVAQPVDPPTLAAQLVLHNLEEIVIGILRLGHILVGKPCFLNQGAPDLVHQCAALDRNGVVRIALELLIVETGAVERGLMEFRLLRFHHIGHIDQLVIP